MYWVRDTGLECLGFRVLVNAVGSGHRLGVFNTGLSVMGLAFRVEGLLGCRV